MLYPDYIYIDTAFDGVKNRNNLIKSSELNPYARRWRAEHNKDFVDCYATYFRYPKDMIEHFKENNTVSGYSGSLYSDFLPIDIDSVGAVREPPLQTTKAILLNLQTKFDVDIKAVPIYFSGAKGFHVEIPSGLFGFNPSPRLHEIFKSIVNKLLPEEAVIDYSIYDKVRLWRIKNTINSKSGLYKIPLPVDELFNLTIPEIKELAKTPRNGVFFDDNVTLNPSLRQLYSQVEGRSLGVKEHKKYMKVLNGGAREGERNTTLTSYAGRVKSKGIAISEAQVIIHSINRTLCNPPLSDAEVKEILESVYSYPSKEAFRFNTIPWSELVGGVEPELDFLIEDILPSGNLIILAGKPKLGKSLLALQMALSVSLDTHLWDKKVKNGGALLISTEDGHIRLKKRIWRMVGDPDNHNPDCHFYVNNCILTDIRVMDALRDKVEELKPRLVILDPLINLFQGKELNSGEHMNAILRPLQELARESGACILVVHHTRKTGGENPVDIIQGSITISG
ncbi:MAG: AAA family ATPase, partial [Candidatus Dadabacteria bacterium]|nr:AAA family ATPase [Candidatus Dadabacteria bacterium]